MRSITRFSDDTLCTIVYDCDVSGVLRDECFAELQRRWRVRYVGRAAPPIPKPGVEVMPTVAVGGR